jgi:hypothetical protein
MPTEMSIPDHYQIQYGDMFEGKLQQKKNRLADYVTIKNNCAGRYATVEQIDPIDLEAKTARFQKTEIEDVVTSRRFIFPKSFQKTVGFDEDDGWKLNQINVPIMESATQLYQGAQRKMEQVIIQGINGINKVGNGEDEAMVDVSLPSSQQVAVNYDETGLGSNTDLTLEKLRKALQILQEAEAFGQDSDEDTTAVCAVSARQLNSLLRIDKLTSADYAEVKALVHGEIDTAFGFHFIRTQQLEYSDTTIRDILCWAKTKVCFGMWDNYKSRLSIRDDLSEATQYRVKASFGATRKEEKGVVRIYCDESV